MQQQTGTLSQVVLYLQAIWHSHACLGTLRPGLPVRAISQCCQSCGQQCVCLFVNRGCDCSNGAAEQQEMVMSPLDRARQALETDPIDASLMVSEVSWVIMMCLQFPLSCN
jgi:hypothetical protein